MRRMNYEKRLMNAPASNHFPDKYAHTYSFFSLTPQPPYPSTIESALFFFFYSNSTLWSHHSTKSLTSKYNQ